MIRFVISFFCIVSSLVVYGVEENQEQQALQSAEPSYSAEFPIPAHPDDSYFSQEYSSPPESKSLTAFWKSHFKIYTITDRSSEDTVLSTEVYTKINWNILDSFSIGIEGLVIGRNGFTQSIYDRPDRRNGFHFIEGLFKWRVLPYLEVKFGNVKQDFLEAPLLITDKTFPSVIGTVYLRNSDSFKLSMILQQAIPSNATGVVKRESQIIETPYFTTASLFLDQNNSFFNLKNRLTVFYFSNLSSAIANQGKVYGNTIDFIQSDSKFKYRFTGIYNGVNLQIPFSGQWYGEIGGDIIYNLKAPDTYNQGERVYGSLYYDFYDLIEIKLSGEYFANQSDTSVSYYNSEIYGHNNRVGFGINMQGYFYSSGLIVKLSYIHNRPINPKRSAVGISNSFMFLVGTNYVSI